MLAETSLDEIIDFQQLYRSLTPEHRELIDEASERLWCYAGDELIHQDEAIDDLLMKAAVMRDEYHRLPEPLQTLQGVLAPLVNQFNPPDPECEHEARRIFDLCERGETGLQSVWSRSALSQVTFGKTIVRMATTGLIKLSV